MNYLRLIGVFFRVNIAGELAYRINFLFSFFESVMGLVLRWPGWRLFSPTLIHSTAGARKKFWRWLALQPDRWGYPVAILPGMQQLTESVRDGTFDFTLTKPEDAQLIATFSRVAVWKIIDIFLGLVILIIALARMGSVIGGVQAVEFLGMLLTGSVIVYSFFLILATLAFWLVRWKYFDDIPECVSCGRWPLSLYPGWLRYGLIFVIPVAFAHHSGRSPDSRLNWVTLLAAFIAAAFYLSSPAPFGNSTEALFGGFGVGKCRLE